MQDKIELKNFIINAGIRFDYFNPKGNLLNDPSDPSVYNPIRPENRYQDFSTISTRIRKEIRDDQIKGGMVGQYNPSITARLNALKEQIEQTNIEQPLFPDVSKNDGDK